ncbi:MAG: 50S ribosomal protein L20 [Candidatus Omnitrophica bacterium]|nr:50S ribosomal protein L20 [Candidatus Omnitrophota bacterium]
MAKVKWAVASKLRRKRLLKKAKGQFGGRSKLIRTAKESVQKGMTYNYRDRKQNKRNFRSLWIIRINAACNELGISYSKFINGLKTSKIEINRKVLADLAANDPKAFKAIVKTIQG